MRERARTLWRVSVHEMHRHLAGQRMWLISPLVIFFLAAACYGFADPRVVPAGLEVSTPADVLFMASTAVVFVCTLAVVLLGFDVVSRRRLDGELAIDLSQPMPRADYAVSQLLGVWWAALLPTVVGSLIGIILIQQQMGAWPGLLEVLNFLLATALLLWWYTCLQLIASSHARDLGAAVTLGVGTWILFAFLWLIPSLVAASMLGVDVTDTGSAAFDTVQEKADLFSPNGVYQLLMESRLEAARRPRLSAAVIWAAALLWSGVPKWIYIRRISRMTP